MQTYYANISAWWGQDALVAESACATPPVTPSAQQPQGIVPQLQMAIASHQATYADNPAWNSAWIANYRRLSALFDEFAIPAAREAG